MRPKRISLKLFTVDWAAFFHAKTLNAVSKSAGNASLFLTKRINASKITTNGCLLAIDGADLASECIRRRYYGIQHKPTRDGGNQSDYDGVARVRSSLLCDH